MPMLECPDCEVRLKRGICPKCGWSPPLPDAPTGALVIRPCWVDGATRAPDGFCPTGNGYPVGIRCPFACSLCRHPLSWDGTCFACHGTDTGRREDWSFPGARYELEASHWRKVADGPRSACTAAENQAAARIAQSAAARTLDPLGVRLALRALFPALDDFA